MKTAKQINEQLDRIRFLTVYLCIKNFGHCDRENFNNSIYGKRLKRAVKYVGGL
jgi:hypothetical protein